MVSFFCAWLLTSMPRIPFFSNQLIRKDPYALFPGILPNPEFVDNPFSVPGR